MALVEAAIVTRLKADSGVGAILGDRIWPHVAPQNAPLPFIVYDTTTEPEHYLLGRAGFVQVTMHLEIVTDDTHEKNACEIAQLAVAAVRTSIDGFQGSINVTTSTGVQATAIRTCHCESFADEPIQAIDGHQRGRHVAVMQFSIGAHESSTLEA